MTFNRWAIVRDIEWHESSRRRWFIILKSDQFTFNWLKSIQLVSIVFQVALLNIYKKT